MVCRSRQRRHRRPRHLQLADADDSFTVNTVLEDVDANSGWNGQSLTKTGAGTLILNAENTYTGSTTISEGTLIATNVEALGTGNVTDNATLEMNTGGDFDNAISGSGRGEIRRRDAHALRRQFLHRRHHHQRRHAGRQQR